MGIPTRSALERIAARTDPVKKAQLEETPKAHAAFLIYCTMGEQRTLEKVRRHLDAKPSYTRQLHAWSSRYLWQERVKAYDREAKEDELAANEKELKKMNERHAQAGINYQLRALEHIDRLIRTGHMNAMATVQMLKIALDVERVARGATSASTRIEVTGENGGPVQTDGVARIMVYLPQKDTLSQKDATPEVPSILAIPAEGETTANEQSE